MPDARQTASVSSSTNVTSVGGRSVAIVTSTVTGGIDLGAGAAPASVDANTTEKTLAEIGILSAVDDDDREKFDVRNRVDRTARMHTVRARESSLARGDQAGDARCGGGARRWLDRERRSSRQEH